MDDARFDRFTRALSSRRTTLGGLLGLAAGFVGFEGDARKSNKQNRRHGGANFHQRDEMHADKKNRKKKKKSQISPPPGDPGNVGELPKDCAAGTISCNGVCVNPLTDAQNCNGCGNFCGANVACVNGGCVRSCPASQIRCGDLCVDATSNDAHCGGCRQACDGDLTCLNGTCGCAGAGLIACGNECVDLQFADDHCGRCGNPCGANQTCENGSCVAAPCSANEIECPDGRCIPDQENACCSYLDCGAGSGDLICDSNLNRCVCQNSNKGICQRFSNGVGLCNVCCGDGSHICIDDTVCVDIGTSGSRACDCPPGKERCAGSTNAHMCQDIGHGAQDNRRCGIQCEDCTLRGPTSFCCFGSCLSACEQNTTCNLKTCDGCRTCGEGQACCRSGTSNIFGCMLLVNGKCPGAPA